MLKAIIIDDEKHAQIVMKELLAQCDIDVEVVAICSNVPDAVIKINQLEPDVVFLDIEMPEYSGFDLISFFKNVTFEIIFATAYDEFALKAFEISAVDYLLKPIQIEKLEESLNKLLQKLQSKNSSMENRLDVLKNNLSGEGIQKIAIPVSDGIVFSFISEIVSLQAEGSYTTITLKDNKSYFISKNLKYFQGLLDHPNFMRTHRSSVINLSYVEKYAKTQGYIHLPYDVVVPIARDRKKEFEERMKIV